MKGAAGERRFQRVPLVTALLDVASMKGAAGERRFRAVASGVVGVSWPQ